MSKCPDSADECHEWRFIDSWKDRDDYTQKVVNKTKFYCIFCRRVQVDRH